MCKLYTLTVCVVFVFIVLFDSHCVDDVVFLISCISFVVAVVVFIVVAVVIVAVGFFMFLFLLLFALY